MCGIVGFWNLRSQGRGNLQNIICNMTNTLESRGPDDKGTWIDKKNNICLGHRRLSIIELSKLGKQPMVSRNKRYVMSFNGEIYNYKEIKKELIKNKVKLKSNSDTEVLIESISFWGIRKTLRIISGMFAFALFDLKYKKIYLFRDRFGIKPLYFSLKDNLFLFGSQTKSFFKHPDWNYEISYNSLASFFKYSYIPSSQSIYKNTYQVPPGGYIEFSSNGNLKKKQYWNLSNEIENLKEKNIQYNNLENEVNLRLIESVKKHMVSDVSVGSFLSGGIDSSLITALMQNVSNKRIKTFNIGFEDKTIDESNYANDIAKHLRTDHHSVIFSNKDIIDLIPKLNNIYDEPFADSSQLPTILLSHITREKVKVALSGDGGDELFGGYNRYKWSKNIKNLFFLPFFLRKIIGNSMRILTPQQWHKILCFLPKINRYPFIGDKIYKLSDIFLLEKFSNVYPYLISQWQEQEIPLNKEVLSDNSLAPTKEASFLNITEQMQLMDMNNYLPDDILTKVDRASMNFGLEVRVPYLDKDLVKFVWSIDSQKKDSKKILKNILYKYIPKKLVSRPKMGFSVPLNDWLKGPLKDWASELIKKENLIKNNIDADKVLLKWNEHISGKRNWQYKLWPILIYQSWKQEINI
ncbi:MAG: asparagine synthase (glutamine-hydrolyzing) [Pelagibacteraceae bacterium]|nr:asparagine synthase (glutamine-hydrolyzing) [Pelagibacteraceae bacterium]PPR33124.1 MAG: Asparagine synthetase [glutamine-hydrolyzing] 1 [Alphaproteobacteria bacterium MarineAlpha6_Bin5]|tara:strand:+ start:12015 stop:13922 length:1908 start_codon:yes stop_codon:yes gene_type:complete